MVKSHKCFECSLSSVLIILGGLDIPISTIDPYLVEHVGFDFVASFEFPIRFRIVNNNEKDIREHMQK
jgi:hypothetical protein